jgi:hypothetical protein
MFVYRTGGATAGTGAVNAFNKGDPCTNLVAANDDIVCATNGTLSAITINLGPGHFVVVVAAFGDTFNNNGVFNLFVNAPGASCALASEPTAVEMESFTATGYADETLLEWRTGMEVNNLGYNIYREQNGRRSKLNSQMLAGSALMAGPGITLKSGHSYSWADRSPHSKDAKYFLEELDLKGQSTWYGPAAIEQSKRGSRLPADRGSPVMLSALAANQSQDRGSPPLQRAAKPAPISAAQLEAQSNVAMRPAIKMSIKQEGWYRVSQPDLVQAGFDPSIDPRMLRLFVDGKERPLRVIGEDDGRFDSSDAVEFYAIGLDTDYTDTRTYWLAAGSQPGLRIEQVKGKGSRAAPASFAYTVERKDRIFYSALRNGDKENLFGAVVATTPVDQTLNLTHVDKATTEKAVVEVSLQGLSFLPHRVKVEINGADAGEVSFDGQTEGVGKFSLRHSALREGSNTVRLTAQGTETDVSFVESIRITYQHLYTADNDALRFTLSKKQKTAIGGFSTAQIRVIDVTDPDDVREVKVSIEQREGGYWVTVTAPKGGERTLFAFAEGRASRPAALAANRPSSLRQPSAGADFVIISHRDFLESVKPLAALRQSQGLSVMSVDVEDVYDEFSYGNKSPQAIKDLLAFARASWAKAPEFVLLVGSASYDPKNYLGFGETDFVPTKIVDTQLMETASDGWLADLNGDGVDDFAIGRLPARNAQEASNMVAKIISNDQATPSNEALLISDSDETYDFQGVSEQLRRVMASGLSVKELDRGVLSDAEIRSQLISEINRGKKIVNYAGHGSVNQWRANLLTSDDARSLGNSSSQPVFVMMTCLNGYLLNPGFESLAEALMRAPNGGAMAVWASSGLTGPDEQTALTQQAYRLLFDGSGLRLGEVTTRAKIATNNPDVRRTWMLFGDPTMRLK